MTDPDLIKLCRARVAEKLSRVQDVMFDSDLALARQDKQWIERAGVAVDEAARILELFSVGLRDLAERWGEDDGQGS
jgi:hypothetical protein